MPPLHRMPVFYLGLAAILTASLLVARGFRGEASTRSSLDESTQGFSDAGDQPVFAEPEPPLEPEPDGILRTPEGLRRKVLVKSLDLVPRRAPEASREARAAIDYFSIHFVFEETEAAGSRWLRIGPQGGPPSGWVPAESVLEWNTRLMARPTPPSGRPPLVIYRDRTCAEHLLAGRDGEAHGDDCPIEGEEATPADHEGLTEEPDARAVGFPILTSGTAVRGDGEGGSVFEVVSLVSDRAQPVVPDQPPANLTPYLNRVYVAFAIDTTASMQASIDAARALASELARETTRRYQGVTLRLALVEYRDENVEIYGFRRRIVTQFTDPPAFRRALDGLEAATGGDGSVDEQVFDGVAAALPRPEGEASRSSPHLDWPTGRAGELATKLLVLLGDAPDHARDPARAEGLARHARESGISIAAITIDRADLSRDEESRYRAQWRTLADGAFRPLDPARGYEVPIEPLLVSLGAETPIVPVLQVLIDDRIDHARQLAALAAAEAEARLEAYVTSQGLTLDQVHPVLVDLHRNDPAPQARPDPRFGGRKAPSVRRGWIAERVGDDRLVNVEVLISRDELDALIDELASLQQAAGESAADLRELIRIGTAAAAGEAAFLAADRGDMTFADHLRRRRGLPPARPDSLLRQTQSDLLQADPMTREALTERLGTAIAALVRRRAESIWDDPSRSLDGMATISYDWIDF